MRVFHGSPDRPTGDHDPVVVGFSRSLIMWRNVGQDHGVAYFPGLWLGSVETPLVLYGRPLGRWATNWTGEVSYTLLGDTTPPEADA